MLGWGRSNRVNGAIVWPHVLVEKSALSQLAHPSDWCFHSVGQEKNYFFPADFSDSAAECGSVFESRNPEKFLSLETGYWVIFFPLLLHTKTASCHPATTEWVSTLIIFYIWTSLRWIFSQRFPTQWIKCVRWRVARLRVLLKCVQASTIPPSSRLFYSKVCGKLSFILMFSYGFKEKFEEYTIRSLKLIPDFI